MIFVHGLTISSKTYELTSHDNSVKKNSPIIRSQGHNLVSATKAITETNLAARRYKNYSDQVVKILQ